MPHSFISRRGSNAGRSRKQRSVPEGQPVRLAEHTTKCPACGRFMVEGQDMIVFDYTRRTWVHDNGECRTNDTLNT